MTDDTATKTKTLEWLWKILSVLVIPLLLWGVKLEVKNAVQDAEIAQLQTDLEEATSISSEVEAQGRAFVEMKTELKYTNKTLDEIKILLKERK